MRIRPSVRTAVLTVTAVLLILMGVGAVMDVFRNYSGAVLNEQDANLKAMAHAIDRNIRLVFSYPAKDLKYVTERVGFREDEADFLTTGQAEGLLARMRENPVAAAEGVTSVIAVRNGETVLSTDGNLGYSVESARKGSLTAVCTDTEGKKHLAVGTPSAENNGLYYYALMGTDTFFRYVLGEELTESQGLVLYDEEDRILLRKYGSISEAAVLPENEPFSGKDYGAGTKRVVEQSTSGGTEFYFTSPTTGKEILLHLAVLSEGDSENGVFSVGVAADYGNLDAPLKRQMAGIVACLVSVMAGIMLMTFTLFMAGRAKEDAEKKLHVLDEENKRMEELIEKTRALARHQRLETLGTMTSGIAHEFNNLLTPIMGYSLMALEKTSESSEIFDQLLEIYNASEKAKNLVSRLNELSRKSSESSRRSILPGELLKKVELLSAPARPKNITVTVEPGTAEKTLNGNETQLCQLLLNIVLNAFHAAEETDGTVTLSAEETENEIVFTVRDTGHGIPEDVLPHIFEPFFTTKESGKGTGLGLAIVREIADTCGASVGVKTGSEGTVFTVVFPAESEKDCKQQGDSVL